MGGESGSGKSNTGTHQPPASNRPIAARPSGTVGTSHHERARAAGCPRQIQMVYPRSHAVTQNPRMSVYDHPRKAGTSTRLMPDRQQRGRACSNCLTSRPFARAHRPPSAPVFRRASASASPLPGPWRLNPSSSSATKPCSALDVSIQHKVIALLESLRHRLGISFLFIGPRSGRVRDFADTVIVIKRRDCRAWADAQIFRGAAAPLHPTLLAANLDPDPCSGSEADQSGPWLTWRSLPMT